MAQAAFTATLKVSGSSVAMTGEACSLVSGTTYQVTDSTKRCFDTSSPITVYDGGVPIAAGNVTVDFLFGKVTLSAPPGGAVTVDAAYVPLFSMAEVRSFEINLSTAMLDDTVCTSTTAVRSRTAGLSDASGTVTGLDVLTTDLDSGAGSVKPLTIFQAGTYTLLEVDFATGNSFRAWVVLDLAKVGGSWDALVEGTIDWKAVGRTSVASGAGSGEVCSFSWG